ncbi:hypothetical protein ACJX0J_019649, partial [Zea mays]
MIRDILPIWSTFIILCLIPCFHFDRLIGKNANAEADSDDEEDDGILSLSKPSHMEFGKSIKLGFQKLLPCRASVPYKFEIYLHQLTSNAIVRLSVHIWALRSQGMSANAEATLDATILPTEKTQRLHAGVSGGTKISKEKFRLTAPGQQLSEEDILELREFVVSGGYQPESTGKRKK